VGTHGRHLTRLLSLGATDTYNTGHIDGNTTYGSDPKRNQINLQTVYSLSKCTEVYLEGMYQHVTGKNYVASVNTAGGDSGSGNQVLGTVGMRTRF
jgi:general bacterial porin, GBP family